MYFIILSTINQLQQKFQTSWIPVTTVPLIVETSSHTCLINLVGFSVHLQ